MGGRRRPLAPPARAVTMRAIAGLVRAERRLRACMGLTLLWALRGFRAWADVLRLAGLGYLARRRGVRRRLDAAAGRRRPVRRVGASSRSRSSGSASPARPVCAREAAPAGCSAAAGAVDRRPCSSRRPGSPSPGLLLEAFFRAARLQSLQAFDAWAFWVPKAKAIYFFGGLDEQVFTTLRRADVSAAPPDPRRGGVPRDGRRRRRHVPPPVLVPRRGCGRRDRRAASTATCPPGSSGRRSLLVLVVPRFGERLLTPQADVLVDVLFAVGALLLALWLRDRRRVAARRRRRAPRGRDADEARGPALRRVALARGVRRDAGAARRPRVARARRGHGSSSSRRRSPGGSGTGRTTSRARRRRASGRRRRSTARSTRSGCRSTCCSTPRSGRSSRSSSCSRSPRRSPGATAVSRPSSPALLALVVPRRRLGHVLVRRCRSPRTSPSNPIVRYTGAIVVLAAVVDAAAARVGLARRPGGAGVTRSAARLLAAAIVAVPLIALPPRRRGRRRPLPVGRRLRPDRLPGDDGRARPRLRPARHDRRGRARCSSASGASATSTPRCAATDAGAGRCSTTGSSPTSRARAPPPRRTAPASRRGSRSSRPADRPASRFPVP